MLTAAQEARPSAHDRAVEKLKEELKKAEDKKDTKTAKGNRMKLEQL